MFGASIILQGSKPKRSSSYGCHPSLRFTYPKSDAGQNGSSKASIATCQTKNVQGKIKQPKAEAAKRPINVACCESRFLHLHCGSRQGVAQKEPPKLLEVTRDAKLLLVLWEKRNKNRLSDRLAEIPESLKRSGPSPGLPLAKRPGENGTLGETARHLQASPSSSGAALAMENHKSSPIREPTEAPSYRTAATSKQKPELKSKSVNQNPVLKWVYPDPCKELSRRPQLFLAGTAPY